jgi:hypothetical protein
MEGKKTATFEDAQLVLRLYELRREEKLREARDWYFREFSPEKIEDIKEILAPGHPHNTHFRMVVSYWDMAASFAVRGPLDASLLLESGGEMLGVWVKLEKFIAELREALSLPEYLRNIEEIINQVEWAPGRMQWMRERIASRQAQTPKTESA